MIFYRDPKANKIFKVGDKVRIKSLEEKKAIENKGYSFEYSFVDSMEEYCGMVLEVVYVKQTLDDEEVYILGLNGETINWNWGKDMFDYSYNCQKVISNE